MPALFLDKRSLLILVRPLLNEPLLDVCQKFTKLDRTRNISKSNLFRCDCCSVVQILVLARLQKGKNEGIAADLWISDVAFFLQKNDFYLLFPSSVSKLEDNLPHNSRRAP